MKNIIEISFGYKNKVYIQINFVLNKNKVLQFMNVESDSRVNFLFIDNKHWMNKYLNGSNYRLINKEKKYILISYR